MCLGKKVLIVFFPLSLSCQTYQSDDTTYLLSGSNDKMVHMYEVEVSYSIPESWSPGEVWELALGEHSVKYVNCSSQSGKLVTKFKVGVRVMYLCVQSGLLYVGLNSGSILVIDLEVRGGRSWK